MEAQINFLEVIERTGKEKPEQVLLTVNEESVTYSNFYNEIQIRAHGLKELGIKEEDKVALIVPNCVEWYRFFWASVMIGAYPAPIDPQSGLWELQRLLKLMEVKVCVIATAYRGNLIAEHLKTLLKECESIEKVIIIDELETQHNQLISLNEFLNHKVVHDIKVNRQSDILSFACTSGSTGNPKILEVPFKGFYKAMVDMSVYLGITSKDKMLIGMPLYHQGGFGMGLQTVVQGGMISYQIQFDPESFLDYIEAHKITIIQLTTTLAKILISTPRFFERDLSSLRICYFAGEVLTQEIAACFIKKIGVRVINVIGSSETGTMVVWDSTKHQDVSPNVFRPLTFTKVKIMNDKGEEVQRGEIGELMIYTDAIIKEYYKNRQENALRFEIIDGVKWFKTGDLVLKHQEDQIEFIGRCKRIIKRGANLVYPEEVESFLLSHPLIEAIAIVKGEHSLIGEEIIAYIQTKDQLKITRGDLLKFSKGKFSAYKLPDKVIQVAEIPHDIGKVQYKYI